ncbi:hypothetical protein [Pseudomonas hormoni]
MDSRSAPHVHSPAGNLTATPMTLPYNPGIGRRLEEFQPRDVRRIQVSQYKMRYEIADSTLYHCAWWYSREDR